MFLEGLKFSLGLLSGLAIVCSVVTAIIVLWERVDFEMQKRRNMQASMKLVDLVKKDIARRGGVLLLVRASNWMDKPAEAMDRRTGSVQ
jgi:hypothetical protein